MEITKDGAQILRMKMRDAELYLKGATVITPCCSLQQDCLAAVEVGKTKLLPLVQLRAQKQAFN